MSLFTHSHISPPPHGLKQSEQEQTLNRAQYAGAVIVPLAFVPKGSRPPKDLTKPHPLIPVVDEDAGTVNPMDRLHQAIREEAEQASVPVTPQFLANSVGNLLRSFQAGYEVYLKQKQGTGDLVYETKFTSGRTLVLARTQTLRMCGLLA